MTPRRLSTRVLLIASVLGLAGCGSPDGPKQAVTKVFTRWNELAGARDPSVAGYVCANPATGQADAAPVLSDQRGFSVPSELNVQVEGDTATVDFLDLGTDEEGDDTDVHVTLVKEGGNWKVCRLQVTAPGGSG